MQTNRFSALLLSLALMLSLCVPALAANESEVLPTREEAAAQAATLAAQYGEATSVQYALWEDGKITLSGSTGVYSKTENRAITTDTLYGIGSVSKVYTTAAVMKLVDDGKVKLDTPITQYLPNFRMADERYKDITVRMLLNHSSGLLGSSTNDAFLFADTDQRATSELLRRLQGDPKGYAPRLKADPGAMSVYCNDGFTLAELLVEAVSGQEFTEFLHNELLAPLNLSSTFTPQDRFDLSRLAKIYQNAEETRTLPQETLGIIGSGGIYASASDLAAFGGALTGDGLLSSSSRSAMQNAEYKRGLWPVDDADSVAYGLGWDSVKTYPFAASSIQALNKGGDSLYYHANLVVIPEHKMAAAVLSSGGVSTLNQQAASEMLIDALAAKGVTVDEKPLTLPAAELASMPADMLSHAGYYGNLIQQMQVSISADGLLTLHMLNSPNTPDQSFRYYSDGSFRDETGQGILIKLLTESNGLTYFYQKSCSPLSGLGYLPMSQYMAQKLPPNDIDPALQAQWDAVAKLPMLPVNMKYSSAVYMSIAQQLSATEIPEQIPGYLAGLRITNDQEAQSLYQIPNMAGRDSQDLYYYKEEDVLHQRSPQGLLFRDASALANLYTQDTAVCTITGNEARWYVVAASDAGKTMQVSLPPNAGFYVYDATGKVTASSVAYGDESATLPKDGLLVFAGAPGARFSLQFSH